MEHGLLGYKYSAGVHVGGAVKIDTIPDSQSYVVIQIIFNFMAQEPPFSIKFN